MDEKRVFLSQEDYDCILAGFDRQTIRIATLEAENARLRSALGAISVGPPACEKWIEERSARRTPNWTPEQNAARAALAGGQEG